MGADGGVSIYRVDEFQAWLQDSENRSKLANYLSVERDRGRKWDYEIASYNKVIAAIKTGDVNQIIWSISTPWAALSSVVVDGKTIELFHISYGTNAPDIANDMDSFLPTVISTFWSQETWT